MTLSGSKGTRYSVHFKHFKGILLCILPPVGVRKVLVLIQEMQTPDLKHLTKTLHLIMVVMTMRYAMKFNRYDNRNVEKEKKG